ncbi:MAG: hypothetical protein JOZ03_06835 [Gammaproteobacteria bacterium]|nr:hypothetical protein [Gammaproteobacteria bacterium]
MVDVYVAQNTTDPNRTIETSKSAVSWAAIIAGAAVAIATTAVVLSLGSGLGLASLSPGVRSTASATGAGALAIAWIVIVQWLSAGVGGYVTGRLRTRWVGTHTHEVFFRDTAHGFVTWAVATVIVAVAAASATSRLLPTDGHGPTTGSSHAGAGQESAATAYDVDLLFRGGGSSAATSENREEANRILAYDISAGDVPNEDRAYLAKLVSERTGVAASEAQRRVDDTIGRLQEKAEAARKAAATASLVNALAMLLGAFIACAAAAIGGRERDRHP